MSKYTDRASLARLLGALISYEGYGVHTHIHTHTNLQTHTHTRART